MRDDDYYVIQGWMRNKLSLKGNELHVYALIYGYVKDKQTEFYGSIKYISNAIGASKPTVMKALHTLVEKKLLTKVSQTTNNITFCRYKLGILPTGKETLPPGKEMIMGGGKETLPNNTIKNNYKDNTKEYNADYIDVVNQFCMLLEENDPKIFKNKDKAKVVLKWYDPIRLLVERDERTIPEIETVMDWALTNDFWKANILSTDKLRGKFPQLLLQAGKEKTKKGKPAVQKEKTELELLMGM